MREDFGPERQIRRVLKDFLRRRVDEYGVFGVHKIFSPQIFTPACRQAGNNTDNFRIISVKIRVNPW